MRSGFHKLLSTLIIISIFIIVPPFKSYAQTNEVNDNLSFVINSQRTYYGFNAGSNDQELRFRFSQQSRQNILFIDKFENNQFYTIGAYNGKGFFVLIQDHPGSLGQNRLTPSEFDQHFSDLLLKSSSTPDVNSEGYSLNHWIIPNSNLIFADKFGKTIIIYSGKDDFQIIKNDLPFIGVTYNYPYISFNLDLIFNEQDYLHDELLNKLHELDKDFSEGLGIGLLTELQPVNSSLTSVLISPGDNQVYVSLNKNADEIWRFDINGGTVETHLGFDKNHKANIPKLGITTSDLEILNFSNEDLTRGIIAIAIVIVLIILFSVFVYLPRNNQTLPEELP